MSLLTTEEYKAIAATLSFPTQAFVDGSFRPALSGRTFEAVNRSYADHLAAMGETSEYLDRQAMQKMTGSRHYVSGLYTPGTVMLQPAGYVRGLAEGLRRDGVGIFENTPVTSLDRQGTGRIAKTPRARVAAGKVIFANNGQLESFGFARNWLMHIFLYASMTVDLGDEAMRRLGGRPRWGITPSGSLVRDPTGQPSPVPVPGDATFEPGMVASGAAIRRTAAVHRQKFDERFPQIRGTPMEHSWAGHLCLSRNGVAVTREPDLNLYSACVQNGLGTARGT